jgi:uncharacterized protein YbbC (DUF1343 family)
MIKNPRQPRVRTGLSLLRDEEFARLQGLRIGLVTHPAAVDERLQHAVDMLARAPRVKLAALFGPEHGFAGTAQDLKGVRDGQDLGTGLRIHSLYGSSEESLRPSQNQIGGLDALVIDLQDVGSRYYTFQATMLFCLEAAAKAGLKVLVLDRPNPLGGSAVEGPLLQAGYESFVGIHPLAIRHGMTIGELARMYQSERNIQVDLEVVPCEGWRREMDFDETVLPWVLPSPNMPTVDTAFVYPGQCLIEGTNLSEGRGTTRPFELCGAPWISPLRLCQRLEEANLPGVAFRPAWFQPTFQKFMGQICGGVQLHAVDREAFRPLRTSLVLLAALRELSGPRFAWRTEPYEFVSDRLAIDLLFGSDRERRALEGGRSPGELLGIWEQEEETFRRRRQPFLLY